MIDAEKCIMRICMFYAFVLLHWLNQEKQDKPDISTHHQTSKEMTSCDRILSCCVSIEINKLAVFIVNKFVCSVTQRVNCMKLILHNLFILLL
jgi:hypothetical protein